MYMIFVFFFFFSSRRRHTRLHGDWSSDVCSSDLPGEGAWQPLVTLKGQPAIRAAFLRPDSQHTSYLVGVVWLNQKLVKMVLHPGYTVPGGSGWSQPSQVPVSQQSSLLATFNSGFTMNDAHGGYWQDGQTAVPLRAGAASMVLYKDGHIDVR